MYRLTVDNEFLASTAFVRFRPTSFNAGTVAHISVHFLTRTTTTKPPCAISLLEVTLENSRSKRSI